jgi:hypothetical protein
MSACPCLATQRRVGDNAVMKQARQQVDSSRNPTTRVTTVRSRT